MRIQLTTTNIEISIFVDTEAGVLLDDLLVAVDQCVKGLGYHPKGELQYELPLYETTNESEVEVID